MALRRSSECQTGTWHSERFEAGADAGVMYRVKRLGVKRMRALWQSHAHESSRRNLQGYRDDDGLFLESDTDEELLIHIPFTQGGHVC